MTVEEINGFRWKSVTYFMEIKVLLQVHHHKKTHTRVQNFDFVLVPIGLEGQYSCDANGGHARHDLSWFSD